MLVMYRLFDVRQMSIAPSFVVSDGGGVMYGEPRME